MTEPSYVLNGINTSANIAFLRRYVQRQINLNLKTTELQNAPISMYNSRPTQYIIKQFEVRT